MSTDNPFLVLAVQIVQTRIPLETIGRNLTALNECVLRDVQQAQHPIRRSTCVRTLRARLTEVHDAWAVLGREIAALDTDTRALADRVEAGEDLSHFEVTIPWVRR